MTQITAENGAGRWALWHKDGSPAEVGQMFSRPTGAAWRLAGGEPPRHSASSGRVWIRSVDFDGDAEYFPHVIDLVWRPI